MADANTFQFLTTLLTTVSNVSEGRAVRQQSEAQASVSEAQAARERQVSADEERDFRRRQSAAFAEKRAALGASGTEAGTGTPLLTMGDFAREAEIQAQRIREGGRIRSSRLEEEAEFTRRAGRSAERRGFARGGASLLSGLATRLDGKTETTTSPSGSGLNRRETLPGRV